MKMSKLNTEKTVNDRCVTRHANTVLSTVGLGENKINPD